MKEYFRKPYMTQGITKHEDYMKAIPQRAIDVQGQIAPNIEFKKPYDYHPNSPQMIHYYANNLHYLGGDPVPPLNDPSLLPHAPVVETPPVVEPYSLNVQLMMHLNNETQLADSSHYVRAIAPIGSPQIVTGGTFGKGALYLDGASVLSVTNSADFDPAANDFTMEFWWKHSTGINYSAIFSRDVRAYSPFEVLVLALTPPQIQLYATSNGVAWDIASGSLIGNASTTAFVHYAICRSGNNLRLFSNGTQTGATIDVTGKTFLTGNGNIELGRNNANAALCVTGWMNELRYDSRALYLTDFTPPTREY